MYSIFVLIFSTAFVLPTIAQASEKTVTLTAKTFVSDCEQSLSSYHKQRAGADPKLIDDVREASRKVQTTLLNLPVAKKVKALIGQQYARESRTYSTTTMSDGRSLKLKYRARLQQTDIVLTDKKTNEETVLFGSSSIPGRKYPHFWNLFPSPDGRTLALTYTLQGSIDDFHILLYDLEKRVILRDELESNSSKVVWLGNDKLLFHRPGLKDGVEVYNLTSLAVYDLNLNELKVAARKGRILSQWQDFSLIAKGSQNFLVVRGSEYDVPLSGAILGADAENIYIKSANYENALESDKIVAVSLRSLTTPELEIKTIVPANVASVQDAAYRDGFLLVHSVFGQDAYISVYDTSGAVISIIRIPPFSSVLKWEWQEIGRKLELELDSPIWRKRRFTYDLKTKKFSRDVEKTLLTDREGERFEYSWLFANGLDGLSIPVLVFHKPGLLERRDSSLATLIHAYGGFEANDLHIGYEAMYPHFLARGGILVAPALRGGSTYGRPWNAAATGIGKKNTFEDLIAVEQMLQNRRLTQPKLTVAMGASNGGLTVSTAALMRPELMGLAIVVNGVLDFMDRQKLDSRTRGWISEYGDAETAPIQAAMTSLSPVELAKACKAGNILTVTGLHDSRVNPEHSIRFYRNLSANAERLGECYWLALKNGGHWTSSVKHQRWLGLHAQNVIWTAIFKQFGWEN